MPTQRPPDVPGGLDPKVADYLRRLATWAYQEIDGKVPKAEAVPQLLLSASDQKPPKVIHALTINAAGAINATVTGVAAPSIPLGGGKP
jgi:hypothetical protein